MVSLPLVPDTAPKGPDKPIPTLDKAIAAKHTILLVDDNQIIRKLIGRMLGELGFHVKMADDGIEGVALVASGLSLFSLVFLDLTMPRLDGYAAATRMREIGYKGPIIALTAKASSDEADTVKRAGMNDILWKPVCKRDLILAISRHVPSFTPGAAAASAAQPLEPR